MLHHHFHHDHYHDRRAFAMGRHRHRHGGRHGFGPFGGGFGPGGGHFHGGRKLSSTDLQLVILALLEGGPSHGYELIKTLEERSGGFYVPSPGMIYPALTYLEEADYAAVEPEGAKKRYRLTDEGRHYLGENRETVDALLDGLARAGERMEHMRRFFREEGADNYYGNARGFAEFNAVRHELKMAVKEAMRRAGPSAPEELRRVVAILKRAAAEIRDRDASS
jgi:DNA-binding PadR family transcriptional regulator